MLKAAIVGCGGIAAVHSAVLNDLSDVELTACSDIRPERAAAMAEKYQLHAYNSLEQMLDNEQIDVLHICTPHYLHVPCLYGKTTGNQPRTTAGSLCTGRWRRTGRRLLPEPVY